MRRLAKALYEQDYLDADEMDKVIRGVGLGVKDENKVRKWDTDKEGPAVIDPSYWAEIRNKLPVTDK